MVRKTKIVCTVGPATEGGERLAKLIQAGMDVARINFSHGNKESYKRYITDIRRASRETGKQVAIMVDTRGPELRIGEVPGDEIRLASGDCLRLTTAFAPLEDPLSVPVLYGHLASEIDTGERIFLDDGLIELEVTGFAGEDVCCSVVEGGVLKSKKGLHIPGHRPDLPYVSDRDREEMEYVLQQGIDCIAASFVCDRGDLEKIREICGPSRPGIQVVAKIETKSSVRNYSDILKTADGIMVARGDLGVELAPEKVPLLQKRMIKEANRAGKPVITATQMMESMTTLPRPTRAEASDVANAILDGTDAVMLSGETAVGQYPFQTTKTMARIALEVEGERVPPPKVRTGTMTIPGALGRAVCSMVEELGVTAIVAPTRTGYTARMMSRFRPCVPIVATTPDSRVRHQLMLSRGVFPLSIEKLDSMDDIIGRSVEEAQEEGFIEEGDLVIIAAGVPRGRLGTTDLIKVHRVGKKKDSRKWRV